MKHDLTISIVNHSNPKLLHECLSSIYSSTRAVTFDVCVVDNATDGTGVAEMQREFPDVRWLFNDHRQGFSYNHNLVLRSAESPYVCILNDDTVIHDGAFDALVAYMKERPNVGMVGAKLLNGDGTLQNCTFRFFTFWSEFMSVSILPGFLGGLKTVGIHPAQKADIPCDVDWVLGACILVRRETLQDVGLLDAELSPIAITEEVDWCYRARKAGWKVGFCPEAVITHYGGQSLQSENIGEDKMRVEMIRTRIAFFRKHYGNFAAFLLRLTYLAPMPWNALMLLQSMLRKRGPQQEHRNLFYTFRSIAGVIVLPTRVGGKAK
jgi:GT2 family glycosyltransferase